MKSIQILLVVLAVSTVANAGESHGDGLFDGYSVQMASRVDSSGLTSNVDGGWRKTGDTHPACSIDLSRDSNGKWLGNYCDVELQNSSFAGEQNSSFRAVYSGFFNGDFHLNFTGTFDGDGFTAQGNIQVNSFIQKPATMSWEYRQARDEFLINTRFQDGSSVNERFSPSGGGQYEWEITQLDPNGVMAAESKGTIFASGDLNLESLAKQPLLMIILWGSHAVL